MKQSEIRRRRFKRKMKGQWILDPKYTEAIAIAAKSIQEAIDAEIINKILEKQK